MVLEAWRTCQPEALHQFPRHVRVALFDSAPVDSCCTRIRSASSRSTSCRGARGGLASELKALVTAIGSELRIDQVLVASMLYYWLPEQRCAIEGWKSCRRLLGPVPAGRNCSIQHYWRYRGRGQPRPRPGRRPTCVRWSIRRRTWSPTCRCPVFSRRAWTEHRHRARPPGQPRDRRVHHRVPPEDRGSKPCRTTPCTPGRSRPLRDRAARDRDLAGHRWHAAADR